MGYASCASERVGLTASPDPVKEVCIEGWLDYICLLSGGYYQLLFSDWGEISWIHGVLPAAQQLFCTTKPLWNPAGMC
jgi:hypothetical protein